MRWPATFRVRLTLRWTVTFGILLALANAAIYVAVRVYAYQDLDAKIRTLAATETASSTDGNAGVHVHDFPVKELGLGNFTEKFVQIYSAQGELVVSSAFPGPGTPFVPMPLIAAGLAGEVPQAQLEVRGRSVRLVVLRAMRDGEQYAIAAGLVVDDVEAGLTKLAWLLAGVWAFGIVATAVVGFRLASTTLAPIESITRRAAAIARGDVETVLDPPAVEDEIGRMTYLLNDVLARLQQAVHANRRFASDAAHELRGPITAMTGEIDVALRYERSGEEYRETLALVRERLQALTSLTEDLMLLVRTQEGDRTLLRREIDLGVLVAGSLDRLCSTAAARGVRLTVATLPACLIYGDERLLARAFDNVLENAVRYNRPAGSVTVSATMHDSGDERESATVMIRVDDSGPGIPRADWEKVFERFYRVDRSRARHTGGKGLGLAITREVLRVFGGAIAVHTSSDAGTSMEIQLPGEARRPETKTKECA